MYKPMFIGLALLMMLVGLSNHARAQEELANTGEYLRNETAFKDYMLQCAGCHRYDGQGMPHGGVPDFRNSVGLFTRFSAGREYLIRVPGSAQSQLNNADLARVLNWIVALYSPDEIGDDYRPFTSAEVGASRRHRYDDVRETRMKLNAELQAMGLEAAPYTFGSMER